MLKAAAKSILFLPALLIFCFYYVNKRVIGPNKAMRGLTEFLAIIPGFLGIYLRASVYNFLFTSKYSNITIGFGTTFSKPDVFIGPNAYIGRFCNLGWVHISKDVMIGDLVSIPSGAHIHKLAAGIPPRNFPNVYSEVTIGEGTWIGSNSTVMASVGKFSVIGAGSVVTKPIPDYSVAVGVPAKVVSQNHPEE